MSEGAGILPIAYWNNTIYFLVGREHEESGWTGSKKLSDFGGSIEAKHKLQTSLDEVGGVAEDYRKYTAATEFWEETMGLFYNKKIVFAMLKQQKNPIITSGNYYMHVLKIDYNPYWESLFNNAYNYVLSCATKHPSKIGYQYIPSCPEGFTEKTEIKWVPYNEIKKQVDTYSSTTSEYRPEFVASLRKLFADKEFPKLLSDASVFKNPDQIGFVAPVTSEPIIPIVEYKWPSFYPEKDKITKGLINTLASHYAYLLANFDLIVNNVKMAQMFKYIDGVNQFHYEVKSFIYLKAVPGAGKSSTPEAPILPKVYWTNDYCPLTDPSLISYQLGSGAYGTAHKIIGPASKCCTKPINYIVKSTNEKVDTKQLTDILLDTPFPQMIIPSKKTDIFATEVGSLSVINSIVNRSICYNFPYFYGSALCKSNSTNYMYMQTIEQQFDKISINSNELGSLLLQGIMGIFAMYTERLVHGDINNLNFAYNLLPGGILKRPVYKFKNKYHIGMPTDKILYFIDFGMGFIKDKLEPQERIEKDKSRVNNNVNWSKAEKFTSAVIKGPAYTAYKGYYVPPEVGEQAAYIRRHLLDFYLLFDTFNKSYGVTLMAPFNNIRDHFLPTFANPTYFAGLESPVVIIAKTHNNILATMNAAGLKALDEIEFKKLNPTDLMFLGNLDTE